MAISINGTSGISGVDGSAGTPALQGSDTNTGIAFGSDVIIGSTGGTERLRIDSSGRVGIGSTTVPTKLTLGQDADTDGSNVVRIYRGGSSGQYSEVSNTSSHTNLNTVGGGGITLNIGGSEKARLSAAGQLLVGTSGTTGAARLILQGNSVDANAGGLIQFQLGTTSPANGAVLGRLDFCDSDSRTGVRVLAERDGGTWTSGSSHPSRLVFSTTADGASSPTERMKITNDGRIFSLPTYNNTAAASANMHVDSNGIFYRATSSAKYKADIETLEDQYADALLNVRPVWYRSTTGNEPADWSWYGFIAEEVAEIDPRLVHWKTVEGVPNEHGQIEYTELETPVAEGVQYDRFVPHLLNLIKRQQAKIESLETRLAALEVTP